MYEYETIKGYHVESDEREKYTMRYLRVMWNSRERHERGRNSVKNGIKYEEKEK